MTACAELSAGTAKDEGVLLGDVRPATLPPGRGTLASRSRGNEMVQVCMLPPV